MSPTTIGRRAARETLRVRKSISSTVTGTVVPSWPSTTIAAVSPTRRRSMPASSAKREPALVRTEARVARREREPVRVADGLDGAQLELEVEVADEPPQHRELLRVLLAEVRAVRPDDVEELATDCCYPAEVAGPEDALEDRAQLLDLDPG